MRKFKVSVRRVLGAVATLGIILVLGTYVAGDYLRLHLTTSRLSSSFGAVRGERDELISRLSQLEAELANARAAEERMSSYQSTLYAQLEELGSILEAVGASSLLPPSDVQERVEKERETRRQVGLGGAEKDCESEGSCGAERTPVSFDPRRSASLAEAVWQPEHHLAIRLDAYIDVLRMLPIGFPGNGHINSPYGPRLSPFNKRVRMHEGVDLALPSGSRVFATGDGVVRLVNYTSTYGLMIDIEHHDRVVTRYAHLSRALVREGERVCRGEPIGLVGSTGRSTGPHLHYEVRVDDQPRDPMLFFELARRVAQIYQLL